MDLVICPFCKTRINAEVYRLRALLDERSSKGGV